MSAPVVLTKKLKKVQAMRTGTPVMLEALDTLADFYLQGDNTLESRRGLRANLESRGLDLVEEFIESLNSVNKKIKTIEKNANFIQTESDRLLNIVTKTINDSNEFAEQIAELEAHKDRAIDKAAMTEDFLKRFKLTDIQLKGLEEGPASGTLFFSALNDVSRIRDECHELISSQFQSAGLELFDSMAVYQDQAFEKLFTWVQTQFSNLDPSFPEPSPSLLRGLETLKNAEVYYEHARLHAGDIRSVIIAR